MSKLKVGDKVRILNCHKMFVVLYTSINEGKKYKGKEDIIKSINGEWCRLKKLPYSWRFKNLKKI